MTPLTPSTRVISVEALRRHTLARLHKRLGTVDALIRSLEKYERAKAKPRADAPSIIRSRKCS